MAAAPSTTTSPRWDMTTPRARGRCGSPTPASGPSGTGAASIRSRHSSRRRATRTPTPHPERPGQHHLHVDVRSCVSVNTAEEDIVVACGDEIQSSEVGDGVAFEAADMVEVELLQRFSRREPGGADTGLTAVGFSWRYLALQARRQVFFVAPVLRTGTFSQPSRGLTQRRGRDIEGKGRTAEVPFHRGQLRTDHRLDDEPSSASRAAASPSPSIAARQPRSAQSCCATAPATTSYVSALAVARLCAQTAQDAIYGFCPLCSRTDAGTVASLTDPGPGPVALSRSSPRADLRVSLSPRVVPRPTLRDAL